VEVYGKEMSRVLGDLLVNNTCRTPAGSTAAVAAHHYEGWIVLAQWTAARS
jgi:hypothetical protein